jgi:NADPH-dependent curcumin reductase CurA
MWNFAKGLPRLEKDDMLDRMKQVVLRSYPSGEPAAEDFEVQSAPIPQAGEGEVVLRTLWLALDPLIRFALDRKPLTGVTRVDLGAVVYGPTVSEVTASNSQDFAVGDVVEGRTGWREYAAVNPKTLPLRKVDRTIAPVSTALGVLGMPGQTAYAAMITVGRVKAEETVVVSAAAGAVGSTAGQIGKILGARVVGIAGGPEKCAGVMELGFDACVDYKAPDFAKKLTEACPHGIHVYIENVGGMVTRTVLPLMKYGARMPVVGYISYYGIGMEGPGPDHLPGFMRLIMSKGLEVRGFAGIFLGNQETLAELAKWVREGKLRCAEAVVDGLAAAPAAFAGVFRGNKHVGKLLVKVAEPSSGAPGGSS